MNYNKLHTLILDQPTTLPVSVASNIPLVKNLTFHRVADLHYKQVIAILGVLKQNQLKKFKIKIASKQLFDHSLIVLTLGKSQERLE
jgi:hypothetical protein